MVFVVPTEFVILLVDWCVSLLSRVVNVVVVSFTCDSLLRVQKHLHRSPFTHRDCCDRIFLIVDSFDYVDALSDTPCLPYFYSIGCDTRMLATH